MVEFCWYFISDVVVRNLLFIIKVNGEVEGSRQRHYIRVIEFSVFDFEL